MLWDRSYNATDKGVHASVMSRRSTALAKALLSALHYSGADSIVAPVTRGIGAILMLHHVSPEDPGSFEPLRVQKVSPDFVDAVIRQVRASGFDIVSLDEAHFRLIEGDRRRFVCFTFDDGYRDNVDYAYPVFKRHKAPFTVYVPTNYPDGHGDLWWQALARVVASLDALDVKLDGSIRRLRASTPDEKDAAFNTVYWWLRGINETDARAYVRDLCYGIDFDPRTLCHELMMTWDEVRQLAADPLVTIGAHTRDHFALAKLTRAEARAEIAESVRRIQRETAKPCQHFSYPYGDPASAGEREFQLVKEMGFKTGVTARKGLVHLRHAGELTALPRVALDGDYQKPRYVKVLLNGAPFALFNAVEAASRATPVT